MDKRVTTYPLPLELLFPVVLLRYLILNQVGQCTTRTTNFRLCVQQFSSFLSLQTDTLLSDTFDPDIFLPSPRNPVPVGPRQKQLETGKKKKKKLKAEWLSNCVVPRPKT